MKRTIVKLILIFISCCPILSRAQDEVHLKVRSLGLRRIVLAVSPFHAERPTEFGDRVREIIINDLELSGFFRIIDLKDSGEQSLLGLLSTNNPYNSPRNAAVLLESDVDFGGDVISIDARLKELSSDQRIFKRDYESHLNGVRQLGHRIADDIAYYLTGDPGIASSKIAYVTLQGTAKEIAIVDYDGHGKVRVTANGSLNLSPCWSPDGKFIALTSYAAGNPDLTVLRLSDGRMVNASKEKELHAAPAWSPDGKKIALTLAKNGNSDIYTLEVKGSKFRRITQNPSIDSSPCWSPNGREIVFTSGRSGSPQIYIMDSDGGNVRRLTFQGSYNASPTWSPKGDLIAFVSREAGGFQIYTIDVIGENLKRVTNSPGNNENPTWSPNGMWIAFASNRDGQWDIYIVQRDGNDLRRLTHTGGNMSPSWSPQLKTDH